MKCVCDKKAKVFHCYGVGSVHEIRVFSEGKLIENYVCNEIIDTIIIINSKIVVICSRQEDVKEYVWMEVFL
jgi:hypothetical protein